MSGEDDKEEKEEMGEERKNTLTASNWVCLTSYFQYEAHFNLNESDAAASSHDWRMTSAAAAVFQMDIAGTIVSLALNAHKRATATASAVVSQKHHNSGGDKKGGKSHQHM